MSYKKWLFLRILILSLVVILLASGITFFAVRDAKLKRESDEKAKRIAEILEPLKNERKAIQSEMDSIITEFKTGKYSAGTVMFLVTDTDARLYTEIYRLLLQSTHPGIIVVGEDYQSENDITKEIILSILPWLISAEIQQFIMLLFLLLKRRDFFDRICSLA